MTDHTDLIDRYIAMWNESDGGRRRDLIDRTWTADGVYLDPVMTGEGAEGIDAMVAGVQARFPGHAFRRTSNVDAHNGRVRFTWELGPGDGPAVVKGTDFAVVEGGRLAAVTGFFDQVPAAAA